MKHPVHTGEEVGAPLGAPKGNDSFLPRAPTVNVDARAPALRRVYVIGDLQRSSAPPAYNSSGSSFNSASENTGPSTHTYFGPTLQRPQMPMPHFMRFSRVV